MYFLSVYVLVSKLVMNSFICSSFSNKIVISKFDWSVSVMKFPVVEVVSVGDTVCNFLYFLWIKVQISDIW